MTGDMEDTSYDLLLLISIHLVSLSTLPTNEEKSCDPLSMFSPLMLVPFLPEPLLD